MNKYMSRRDFMRMTTAAAAVAAASTSAGRLHAAQALPGRPRVVRVHSPVATRPWDYSRNAPWDHTVEPRDGQPGKIEERYFDYINADEVDRMLEKALCALTAEGSGTAAWKQLLPDFQAGQKITLKLNLNNATYDPDITNNRLDQTMPLVNSVLRGLIEGLGSSPGDITLLDASRWFHPVIMKGRCDYPGVLWVDSTVEDRWDRSESVEFPHDQPQPGGQFWMPKAYTGSDHIINICLMKSHGCGITGAMKNHFGSIPSPRNLHQGLGYRTYIADLCNTPCIREKVRLNMADALFANWHNNVWAPRAWKTFPEQSPNSIIMSTDPVALDSVMLDHIHEELFAQGDNTPSWAWDRMEHHTFLQHAMELYKLGIHEHKPYRRIEYLEIET